MTSTVSIEDTVRVDVETSQLCCADLTCKQVDSQLLEATFTLSFVFATEANAQTYSIILVVLDNCTQIKA